MEIDCNRESDNLETNLKISVSSVARQFSISKGNPTAVTIHLVVLDKSDHPGKGYELLIRDAGAEKLFDG